jgi:phage terminase large subunit-like protein
LSRKFATSASREWLIKEQRWDGEECQIWLPQDPGSAGKFQARYLAGKLQGYTVRTEAEAGDKEYRANPFAAQCEHGFVKLERFTN